jgi:hypothetical protein
MDKAPIVHRSTCMQCEHTLYGRVDKRFCNSACRSAFHNNMRCEGLKVIKAVNKVLLKNYLILLDYWNSGLTEVPKTALVKKGLNWSYFTSVRPMTNGDSYCFVYNIGYCAQNEKIVRILKKEKPS